MKRTIILIITVLFCVSLPAQKSGSRYNPKGRWKFENTSAPAGYSTGIVEIKHAKKKYSVSFIFTEINEVYQAESVSFKNDSLNFTLTIQGLTMPVRSRFEKRDIITGESNVMGNSMPFRITRDKTRTKSKM